MGQDTTLHRPTGTACNTVSSTCSAVGFTRLCSLSVEHRLLPLLCLDHGPLPAASVTDHDQATAANDFSKEVTGRP